MRRSYLLAKSASGVKCYEKGPAGSTLGRTYHSLSLRPDPPLFTTAHHLDLFPVYRIELQDSEDDQPPCLYVARVNVSYCALRRTILLSPMVPKRPLGCSMSRITLLIGLGSITSRSRKGDSMSKPSSNNKSNSIRSQHLQLLFTTKNNSTRLSLSNFGCEIVLRVPT